MDFVDTEKWVAVKSLIKIVSKRYDKSKGIQEEQMTRYYMRPLQNSKLLPHFQDSSLVIYISKLPSLSLSMSCILKFIKVYGLLHIPRPFCNGLYISSTIETPEKFLSLVRSHWSIENNLHWMLDVVMGEDASRKRSKNSPVNFSVVSKTALAMLKKYNPRKKKISIKAKRKMGGWSDECLYDMLCIDPN